MGKKVERYRQEPAAAVYTAGQSNYYLALIIIKYDAYYLVPNL